MVAGQGLASLGLQIVVEVVQLIAVVGPKIAAFAVFDSEGSKVSGNRVKDCLQANHFGKAVEWMSEQPSGYRDPILPPEFLREGEVGGLGGAPGSSDRDYA